MTVTITPAKEGGVNPMAITMTINIAGSPIAQIAGIPFRGGMTARQAMETAYDSPELHTYNFSLEYFGKELGYEVTILDDIRRQIGSDPESFLSWELSLNGEPSQTGIDDTILEDGDEIGWNYTNYQRERHATTRHEEIRSV